MRKFIRLSVVASVFAVSCAAFTTANHHTAVLAGKIELASSDGREGNSVVFLKGVAGNYQPHQPLAVLDQEEKVFVPHLLPVQEGQIIRFKNSDPLTHNVHVYWGRRSMFNVVQEIDGIRDWTPGRTGQYVVLCNIHTEMSAFVLVFDHPFFSTVDHEDSKKSSEFRIENIPEGVYTLVVARDLKGELVEQEKKVAVKAGETSTVNIKF